MSIAEKLNTIAENEQKVYDKGVTDGNEYMRLLATKGISRDGARTNYNRAFRQTNYGDIGFEFVEGYIRPTNADEMFYEYLGITLPKGIDLSRATTARYICTWASKLIELPDFGLQAGCDIDYIVQHCSALKTIEVLRVNESRALYAWSFQNCKALENLTIEGILIGNLVLSDCSLLTHDSLMSVINALKDYSEDTSGTTHTLTIGSENIAKLSTEELAIIIQKGWAYN